MATSTYDVNVQLALATTAEHEGDLDTALDFLAQAHRLGREGDRNTRAGVHRATMGFRARTLATLTLDLFASAF
jgi:hypothetical protein